MSHAYVLHLLVAASVVEHGTVRLGKQTLTASWPEKETASSPQTTVHITGVGELDTDTLHMLYINTSRTGGGPIDDIAIRHEEDTAVITFVNAEGGLAILVCSE